ncbi:peptidoglycan D,D-transpeptidase FtsI family protein [Oleiharenicola lentus]|uniref:peptidoglycan D,D-transpeptidase FtsI family protein n=1 Tax=Oleiharenicola lentus TaxID=2508720 RepID=UPI003F67C941
MSKSIETYSNRNPRLLVFHGIVLALISVLIGGMAFRQLFTTAIYSERERKQNQRRVITPAPRGNIYDRDGEIIVGNRARFSVVLDLATLRGEFRSEYNKIKRNFSSLDVKERPNVAQLSQIARTTVAQRYLDQVNTILKRKEKVNGTELSRHIEQTLLLPYVLLDDLAPEEYARLLERLPVNAPVQVSTSSKRNYNFGSAAAHTLGYIGVNTDPEVLDFPGDDLLQFKMKGTVGRAGLEKIFDEQLQGTTGAAIYLVDPAGYKIDTPLETRKPQQGQDLHTSLDMELQLAAETAMAGRTGAAVAIDVRTGEVLVLASKPDYDTVTLKPNLEPGVDVESSGLWLNRTIQGQYPPGSTFKLITAIASLRAGAVLPSDRVLCPGYYMVGRQRFVCHVRSGHGERDIVGAIRDSCNIFFYKYGLEIGPELIASEARRFGYNHPTGIELPSEFKTPRVADPEWRKIGWKSANLQDGIWRMGDTANTAIGQGDTLITPLQAACMIASLARGETETKPTLLHDPKRPAFHSAPLGLSPSDYNLILEGMKQCYQIGTGKLARVDGLSGAAKSGTAQKHPIELAWLVAFAPAENPQIAVAVVLEGKEDQSFGGGTYAGPVVKAILQAWKDKRDRPPTLPSAAPVNLRIE